MNSMLAICVDDNEDDQLVTDSAPAVRVVTQGRKERGKDGKMEGMIQFFSLFHSSTMPLPM
jgi:hypothetical protein